MVRKLITVVAILMIGCGTTASEKVSLTNSEATQAAALVLRRQEVFEEQMRANLAFQKLEKELSDKQAQIDYDSATLAFKLKVAHNLPVTDYILDEQHAVLVKVK